MGQHLQDIDILQDGKIKDSLLNIVDKTFDTITYAATVSQAWGTNGPNYKMTLTGNLNFSITGVPDGEGGILLLTRGSAPGTEGITLNGTTVLGDLPMGAAAVISLSYINEGGLLRWYCNNPVRVSSTQYQSILDRLSALESGLPTLGTPTVSFGTITSTSQVVNWTAVTNATSYTVKRNTSNTQTGATTIYTGSLLTYTDTGLTASTAYYYFVIPTATSYNNGTAGTATSTTSAGSSYDTDAQAFFTAMEADASPVTLNSTQKGAVNQLVLDLKSASIWTSIKGLYPIIGGTASSHKWNLKDPRDLDAAFRLTFSGTWTHNSGGADPDGTSAYANTYFAPYYASFEAKNSFLNSFYSTENITTTGAYDMGTRDNGTKMSFVIKSNDNNTYVAANVNDDISAGNIVSDSRGLFTLSRTSSNTAAFYKNGTSIYSDTSSSVQDYASGQSVYIGALNNIGSASAFSPRKCAFVVISSGLTGSQISNMYTAIQAFQTTLSRQV